MILGAFLFTTGMVFTGLMDSLWQFYLAYGVIIGAAMSFFSTPVITTVTLWFKKKRGLAGGIVWGLQGMGPVIMAPILRYVIGAFSWEQAFIVTGIVGGTIMLLMSFFVHSKPWDIGLVPYGQSKSTNGSENNLLDGKVEVEGEWGFTLDWETTGWMEHNTWARVKLDAIVHETDTSARVIDYKTGKKFGNEIAHGQQALTYAIGTFFRYPDLEHVQTELWYLDQGETTFQSYTRDEAMTFMPGINDRALTMTKATNFPPNPSNSTCRWCSYKKGEHPMCEWGIK